MVSAADDVSPAELNVSSPQQGNLPSAQTVGREFVRQYYTMLGNEPKYMHRFYGDQSLYLRDDNVAFGQKAIEKQIASFNLKDCHTKIRAVDAQYTIGQGVVVQVLGQIAIDGTEYRNFFQTFVLALQSEKKYYVHNDILRYLDTCSFSNVYSCGGGSADDRENVCRMETENSLEQPNQISINGKADGAEIKNGIDSSMEGTTQKSLPPRANAPPFVPASLSAWEHQAQVVAVEIPNHVDGAEQSLMAGANRRNLETVQSSENVIVSAVKENSDAASEADEQHLAEKQSSSWARVAGSKVTVSNNGFNQQPGAFPTMQQSGPLLSPNQSFPAVVTTDTGRQVNVIMTPVAPVQTVEHLPMVYTTTTQQRPNVVRSLNKFEIPFENQIFLGNLPENVTEDEIAAQLEPYGKIMNISVVRRNAPSSSASFAFVAYHNAESAAKLIEENPRIRFGEFWVSIEKKRQGNMNTSRMNMGQRHMPRPPYNQRPVAPANSGPFSTRNIGNNNRMPIYRNSGPMVSHGPYGGAYTPNK